MEYRAIQQRRETGIPLAAELLETVVYGDWRKVPSRTY